MHNNNVSGNCEYVERLFIRGSCFKKGQDTVNRSAGHTTAHCNDHRGVRLLTSSALQPVASVLVSRRTSDGRAFKMQKWRFCVFSFRERPFYGAERACDQDYDVSQRLIGLGSAVKNPWLSPREKFHASLQSEYAALLKLGLLYFWAKIIDFFLQLPIFAFSTLLARCGYRKNCKNKIDKEEREKRKGGGNEAF